MCRNIITGGFNMKTKKLLKMMIDKSMTKKQLSEKTGISDRQIRRITAGTQDGTLEWWRKAAEVLECSIADIIE
jgi:DNA-binding Xre family transcriptional regulator